MHTRTSPRFISTALGGSVQDALLIADDVHRAGISTIVDAGSYCFSACAYVFFAGATRRAEGQLGVHQISSRGQGDEESLQLHLSDIVEALNRFNIDPRVLQHMLRTSSSAIHVFSREEIAELGIEKESSELAEEVVEKAPTSGEPNADRMTRTQPPQTSKQGQEVDVAAVRECDRLAASPNDPNRPFGVVGVALPQINTRSAFIACERAVAQQPNNVRLAFQLARTLPSQRRLGDAVKAYHTLAAQGYGAAQLELGLFYANGYGVAKDYVIAAAHFLKRQRSRASRMHSLCLL